VILDKIGGTIERNVAINLGKDATLGAATLGAEVFPQIFLLTPKSPRYSF